MTQYRLRRKEGTSKYYFPYRSLQQRDDKLRRKLDSDDERPTRSRRTRDPPASSDVEHTANASENVNKSSLRASDDAAVDSQDRASDHARSDDGSADEQCVSSPAFVLG